MKLVKIKGSYTEPGKIKLENEAEILPTEFSISQNYPNPFNPTTQIRYAMPVAGSVTLKIYNTTGQLVRTLMDGIMGEGNHEVQWDATDDYGIQAASGVYFCMIFVTGPEKNFIKVNKMLLLK